MDDNRFFFGIVIQGPLDSRGFDSRATVMAWIEQARQLQQFDFTICISTWRCDQLGPLEALPANVFLLFNDPPGGPDYQNRRKQIWSSLTGARALMARGARRPDFLLKVRTDQQLDLAGLCDHLLVLEATGQLDNSTVVAPGRSRAVPFYVQDFYYGGRATALLAYFEAINRRNEAPWQFPIEVDFTLKYLCALSPSPLGHWSAWQLRQLFCFWPWLATGELLKRYQEIWRSCRHHLLLFPRSIYLGMVWRGEADRTEKTHLLRDLECFGEEGASPEPAQGIYVRAGWVVRLLMAFSTFEVLICHKLRVPPSQAGVRLLNFWSQIASGFRYRCGAPPLRVGD